MRDRDLATDDTSHAEAATAFVDRARVRFGDEILELYVFGSTVRGDTRGLASDVDVLVVLEDASDRGRIADALRYVAYDVMLAYCPVVELHVLSETEFHESRERGNPFVTTAVHEGRSYA